MVLVTSGSGCSLPKIVRPATTGAGLIIKVVSIAAFESGDQSHSASARNLNLCPTTLPFRYSVPLSPSTLSSTEWSGDQMFRCLTSFPCCQQRLVADLEKSPGAPESEHSPFWAFAHNAVQRINPTASMESRCFLIIICS